MSTEINIKKRITALDESVILTKDLSTINFVGAGVVASSIGEDVTVTIPGGAGSGVTSVTGLDTDNTDPANPIINISVDGVTITGSGTPIDPLVSVDAVSGSGALNFVSKWTGIDSLGNSQIRDNGSKIAVNGSILSAYKFAVYSTTPGENYNIYGNTTVNGAVGIAGVNQGVGASTNYGALGTAQSSTSLNIGVYGQAIGASTENVGGKFSATLATSNYAVQLQDGTEGIGKVLTSMTADGKAQWTTPTGAPAWLESNATDLTIWNNGQGNVATNTSFGDLALALNTTGDNNTSIGYNTLYNNQGGTQNTAIGSNALSGNISSNFNTGIGYGALFTNGSSNYNTAIGASALYYNYGQQNTAIGALALQNNTSGQRNTSVGHQSLYTNTIGSNNVASGMYALYSNTTGNTNVASGYQSLVNNTSAIGNTGIGHQALAFTTIGSSNTVLGALGLYSHTTGSSNTAIGYGTVSGNCSSSIIIGRGATATASNQFVVGSSSYNAGAVTAEVNASTQVWNVIINGVARKILLA